MKKVSAALLALAVFPAFPLGAEARKSSPTPVPVQTPSPAPTLLPSPVTPAPILTPAVPPPATAGPSASPGLPTPQATPAPPTPTPVPATPSPYHFVYTPPAGTLPAGNPDPSAPQISEIDLTDQVVHAPLHLMVRVLTSLNVTGVTARTMGRDIALPKTAPGVFAAESDIPSLPFFLRGRVYDIQFVAVSESGKRFAVTLPVQVK